MYDLCEASPTDERLDLHDPINYIRAPTDRMRMIRPLLVKSESEVL